jgi:XTP/dITP diphosphohydrolase
MLKIVIASNNKHKVKEIRDILKNRNILVLSLGEAGFKGGIEETGETLRENALIKARAVRKKIKNAVIIADDTGLEVEYLAGAPGVYSARFAGPECSYIDNNRKLLKLMKGVPKTQRKALFRTVMAIIYPDGREALAEGRVRGEITRAQAGRNGFGYDPVFYLPKMRKTYAQLDLKQKNSVSHRQKAVKNAWKMIEKRMKI